MARREQEVNFSAFIDTDKRSVVRFILRVQPQTLQPAIPLALWRPLEILRYE